MSTLASESSAQIVSPAINLPPKAQAPHLPRQLSDAEFVMLRSAGCGRRVAAGESLFRKGESGQKMFVIETGEVRIEFGDGLPDKILRAREYFGELALFIGNHARVASAIARSACNLRVVDYPAFDQLLESEPGLLALFMRRSFAYLVASEQQLIGSLKRRNDDLQTTINSLRETRAELSTANRLVRTDELTGLTNRRGLYEFLENLSEHRVAGTHLTLLLIDLDQFKRVNDERGHLVGDDVLRAVADAVSRMATERDLTCRLGGDEFAVLAQLDDPSQLEALAARIIDAVGQLHFPYVDALAVSISIGAAICTADADADWSIWYSQADAALYRAKSQGINMCMAPTA